MIYVYIVLSIIIVLMLVSFLIGKIMVDQLTSSKRCNVDEERIAAVERGEHKKEDFINNKIEPFSVVNKRGERLDGEIIFCENMTNRVCIACHGWTSNRIGMYKYARAILDNNFHVIVYDHTNCGSSEGKYGTMGGYESEDLSDIIDFAKVKFGDDCKILTYGESMGAVTVLLNMAKDTRVDATVADCPFSDLKDECDYILTKQKHLPKIPINWITAGIYKTRMKFSLKEVSPYEAIVKADGVPDIPLLLIHGEEDDFILLSHSEKIKSVKKGYVKLYRSKGAPHARSILVNPKEYREVLTKFIKEAFSQ